MKGILFLFFHLLFSYVTHCKIWVYVNCRMTKLFVYVWGLRVFFVVLFDFFFPFFSVPACDSFFLPLSHVWNVRCGVLLPCNMYDHCIIYYSIGFYLLFIACILDWYIKNVWKVCYNFAESSMCCYICKTYVTSLELLNKYVALFITL